MTEKIGIIAASSACSPERYAKATSQAIKLGYELIVPCDPCANYNSKKFLFSSDSVHKRIEALKSLLADSDIKTIFAARGGYGAVELLHELAKLREHPPSVRTCLSGISDFSAILLCLDQVPNLLTIHGPGFLDAFQNFEEDEMRRISTKHLFEIFEGKWAGYQDLSLTVNSNEGKDSVLRGKLIGGNLSVLAALIGTPFLPDFGGRILFLEETGEKPYKVHRALLQLKQSGIFEKVSGVLLGDFDRCCHSQGLGPDLDDVIDSIFDDFKKPLFRGFPAGHCALNLPLPFGQEIELSATSLTPIP